MKKSTVSITLALAVLALVAGGAALAPEPVGAQAKPIASYLTDVLLEMGPLELPFMTGMTVIDPPKEEMEKARKIARGAWNIWLQRTGADGKRGLELALKALGR